MVTQSEILAPASVLATLACFVTGINLNLVTSFFNSHSSDKLWVLISVIFLLACDIGYSIITAINVYTREVLDFNYNPSVPIIVTNFLAVETAAPTLTTLATTLSSFMFGYQIYWNKRNSGQDPIITHYLLFLVAITSLLNLCAGLATTVVYSQQLRIVSKPCVITLWDASALPPNFILSYLLLSSTVNEKFENSSRLFKLRHYLLNCNTLTSIISVLSLILFLIPQTSRFISLFNKISIVSILSALNSREIQPFVSECRCHKKSVTCQVEQITIISTPTEFDENIEHEKRRASIGLSTSLSGAIPKAQDMGLGLSSMEESKYEH